jgi:hypothetical protein
MIDLPGWQDQPGNAVLRAPRADLGTVSGSLDEIAATLRRYAEEGVDEVHIQLDPETPAGVETFARVVEVVRGG